MRYEERYTLSTESRPLDSRLRETEVKLARVFEFVDLSGCALHTITDPEDQLPIPAYGQEVSIGPIRMWVVSVVLSSIGPQTYRVRVRTAERE